MSDRDAFREAREHGLKARHETREARVQERDLQQAIDWARGLARENFFKVPAIANLVSDERKAVAEEIALALEEMAAYSRNTIARTNVLREASAVAREIGSRDPE